MIAADLRAEADRAAVPAIDRNDGEGEVDEFLVFEMPARVLVNLVRHVAINNPCQCLGPSQCGSLTFTEERESRHAGSTYSRCSVSRLALASLECMSRQ